jgi:hypothetical protein
VRSITKSGWRFSDIPRGLALVNEYCATTLFSWDKQSQQKIFKTMRFFTCGGMMVAVEGASPAALTRVLGR